MSKFITMILRHWSKSPVKIILTLLSVALGTGILILSLSAAEILNTEVSKQLDANGVILYAGNGEWNVEGNIEQTRPSQWDSNALDTVLSDIDSITNAAVIVTPEFNEISADGKSYTLRSAVGSDPEYFKIFSLDIIAGTEMTEQDINMGRKKVWITEEMAVELYGSSEDAVGKWIQPPGTILSRGPGRMRDMNRIINFSVAGVYKTPSEVSRRSYGIGDLVFPYTALVPSGTNVQVMIDRMAGIFAVKSTGSSAKKTESSLRQVLTSNYGYDTDIIIWEGSARGESSYMEDLRQTVEMFTVSVNILGIILLLTSSIGIFSIMVVESLSRRREIALERALGASQSTVIKEFWTWSLTLSFTGAVLGIILSLILAKPVMQSISPLLG